MTVPKSEFCNRALAYLKVSVPDEPGSITLSDADSPVIRNLGHGLLATYLVDQGNHFEYVAGHHLMAAGINEHELHRRAVQNLAEFARPKIQVSQYGQIFALLMGGNFEASMILVDELWDSSLSHLAPSGFVITVPARDILAFCDGTSTTGIAELRQIAERTGNGDHPLTPILFRRRAQSWLPYVS